jgi:hypothetical protein
LVEDPLGVVLGGPLGLALGLAGGWRLTCEPQLVDGTLGLELGDRLGILVGDPLEVVLGEPLGLALGLIGRGWEAQRLVSLCWLMAHWGLNLEKGLAYWL